MTILAPLRRWFAPSPPPAPPPVEDRRPEPPPSRIPREMELDQVGLRFLIDSMGRQANGGDDARNPFDPSKLRPPPGFGGVAETKLAMDEAPGISQWAFEAVDGVLGAREHFVGYPELTLLSQRPEYRSPVEIIATESTRKWIRFSASGDEDQSAKIKRIEAEFERLNVQAVFRQVSEYDGLFGRNHIYVDVGTDLNNRDELMKSIGGGADYMSKLKIGRGSLKELRAIEPVWCWPGAYDSINPLSPNWYRPQTWNVMAMTVHRTRLLTFIYREVPDLLKPAYFFGGQSLTQIMRPVVENWLTTRASVGEIVKKFSHNVIKVNITEALNSGNAAKIFQRVRMFNETKGNFGTMMLDKESEEFVNVSVPLSGLDQLQAQSQEHMSSLSRIPIVKLLGIQPAGLNASSEGELRAFEDFIHSYQESFFRPNLQTILRLVQVSLFGEVDPLIRLEFLPITEGLTELEKSQALQSAYAGVNATFESGLLDRGTALKEMRAAAELIGVESKISDELIAEADEGPPTPSPEELTALSSMVKAEHEGGEGGGGFQLQ